MVSFEIAPCRWVGEDNPCFIIAEVGQNHQGDLEIAKRLIRAAKEAGADCVKFQKSHLPSRFNAEALKLPYEGPNSWGSTYGEHRGHLEFCESEFQELKKCANEQNLVFAASGMDLKSAIFLVQEIKVPFLKVGSGDANNFPYLQKMAEFGCPLVVSTGMQTMETVRRIYGEVTSRNCRLALLQCTSAYPTPAAEVNLRVITTYRDEFPDAVIGYSGHEVGTEITVAAVTLGAKIVERHLTLDRSWKGTDHVASLEPSEFGVLVEKIRNIEAAMGSRHKCRQPSEEACHRKLGKSIVAGCFLASGTALEEEMLNVKTAQPKGHPAEGMSQLVGRRLLRDVMEDESLTEDDVV